jgi:hypothetical protein
VIRKGTNLSNLVRFNEAMKTIKIQFKKCFKNNLNESNFREKYLRKCKQKVED